VRRSRRAHPAMTWPRRALAAGVGGRPGPGAGAAVALIRPRCCSPAGPPPVTGGRGNRGGTVSRAGHGARDLLALRAVASLAWCTGCRRHWPRGAASQAIDDLAALGSTTSLHRPRVRCLAAAWRRAERQVDDGFRSTPGRAAPCANRTDASYPRRRGAALAVPTAAADETASWTPAATPHSTGRCDAGSRRRWWSGTP
jgi:hypothetical protein